MTRSWKAAVGAGVVAALGTWTMATLVADEAHAPKIKMVSTNDAQWYEIVPGAWGSALRGDLRQGAYSSFTKFAPGADHGYHYHTNDIEMVVISGAYLYRDDEGAKRVGPGTYFFIPGGTKHWSGGDPQEGAIFYQHSSSKFDYIKSADSDEGRSK